MTKFYLFTGLLLLSNSLLAQTNYVANKANSTTPPGVGNTLVGPDTGNSSLTGNANTFIGGEAGNYTTSGAGNAFLGYGAGGANTTGGYNVYVGVAAGYKTMATSYNVFLGFAAGHENTTGGDNVFVGSSAGHENTNGRYNTFLGGSTGYKNTAGSYNAYVGYQAGYSTTTCQFNAFLGNDAGYANTSGGLNTFMGYQAGYKNTIGGSNTFMGYQVGYSNTTGLYNTFVGYAAGYNNTTGSNNIIIGPNSGTAITTSDQNVLMGYNSQAEDGLHNAIAIGAGTRVAMSNALILGHQVNVGIGTSAPTDRLEVVSDKPDDSGLRLTNLTTSSPATQSTDQFLTVNQKGEVIKARYQLRINDVSQWSDRVFGSTYVLRPLSAVASYIEQHGHLPGVPSAQEVVQQGVDLVKINATLLEKVEELTLYSIQQNKTLQKQQTEIDELKALVKQLLEKR